nr:MAG TPA: NlpC/P60 family [Caudoviricetes sp.]
MIFKTYENDLDGIFNKLGFNKRTFAEWGSQVKEAFNGAETGANKFYTTLNKISSVMKTAFTVPKDKLDWIKNSQDEIVTKNNIDSYIPQLSQDEADGLVKSIQAQSIAVTNGTKNWQDYFQKLDVEGRKHIIDLIKNTKDLSKLTGDDLVQATNAARESALKHNAALQQETLGAKAATLGLEALSVVGNALISMGIGLAISAIIKGVSSLFHVGEETKQHANEMSESLQSFQESANSNIKTINTLSESYQKLSQKLSDSKDLTLLTTAEREEYHSVCNQIGDIMPSLVKAYDTEGNAILNLKGNIDELSNAYKQNIQIRANQFLTKGDDNGNTIQDMFDEYENYRNGVKTGIFKDSESFRNIYGSDVIAKNLETLSQANYEDFFNILGNTNDTFSNYIGLLLKDKGLKSKIGKTTPENIIDKDLGAVTQENFDEVHDIIVSALSSIESDTDTHVVKIRNILQQMVYSNSDYWNLDNTDLQDSINNFIGGLSFDFINDNDLTNEISMRQFVNNIIDSISNNKNGFTDAWNNLFSLDEQDLGVNDFISRANSYIDTISNALGIDENGKKELLISFGFDLDGLENQYNNIISSLKEKFNNGLTLEDAMSNLEDEYQKITDWGLDDYADDIKNGTIQSKFGNVDMDKRTIIEWSEELKKTYKDELASWEYDPEIGSIDTVFGGNDRFGEDLNGTGWEIAFTPILPDGTFLSRDTVNDYINSILADAYSDDGTVTEEELSAIDAEGRQIGDTFVQGIFGAIDDNTNEDDNWANVVGRLMHFSGKYGAVNLANEEIERAKNSDPDFDWEAWFKENSINTKEELDAWQKVTAGINDATKARKAYLDYMNQQKLDTKSLKELNDSLDKIQSAYQVASTAIEEYNKNGYLSVDTFQSLMKLEPEYLNLLMDENGTLALTSENLYKLTEARINDLAAKQASTLVDSVTKLGSEAEQLDYLTQSTKEATESTWGLVYAKIAEAQAAGTISDDVAGRLKSRVDAYQTWAKNTIDGINKGSLGKSSNSSKSEKDKAKALKDYEDKVKDINEKLEELDKAEHLSNLKYSIETITQDLDTFEKSLDRLSSKLDLTFEKDYSAKLSIIGQQFLGASRYGGEMRVELERLLAIEPQTADEAEELASRLESLSDSFFENEKNIIEYRNSLFETATDYLGESASATVEQVNNAKSILDNTFNVIKNGSLSGDGFWSATLLPSISKDKVTKQRAENNKLIKEEKRYQNAIAKIRKKATDMSYAEEKEEREKQRQEYQEELQEAYEDYQDKINDVIGQNIEVSDSVKNIGDEYMNTADKAENAAQRMSDAMKNINWEQRSYANKSYTYEDGAPTSAQYQYAYDDSKSTVVVTKKAKGGTTTNGLTITGDGTGTYAGQEAYIGQDGRLHLFNNEAQLSELPPNTRIVNAKDLQNIIKYTGMKYFYQPIENIQSATVDKFAQGNTNVSFSPIPYNALSTQALYSDVNVQAMVEETIAEINNEFNALKGNIKFSAVQNAFKNSLTDKKMYKDLSNTIVNMTSQSLDKADKSTLADSVVGLILQNSAWNDLPNELQNKLSELNVNADNWTDWIKDSNNSLQAFNLMQDGGMSSWDLLDSNVTSLLQQAGINGKDAWDKFVQDDPLQALTLLSSSWNSMNDTIGQYMTDAQTIAVNGAKAIQSLQIVAPSISQQSWNALQVLIANKIQEIISLMNEVFGENTVDMNFAINVNNGALSGNSQTNPQGDNEIINTAKSFLGTPYQWGGTSPSGFDCSGFVQYVLAENGKSVPRTSQEQFAGGQAVDKSNLQAGDLVFYNWSGGTEATHVGIYEGNGKMIHAPHSGDVVKEVDFNSYGQNVYLGARRYYKGTEGALPGLAKLGDEAEVRGLNYPTPEILIRQKTGKAYLTGLDGTQIVNLDRGDTVIPYADTKRILNGNVRHAYANGTPNAKDAISRILGIDRVKNRINDSRNNNSSRSNNSGITNNTVKQSWDTNDFGAGKGKSHSYTAFDENGYLGSQLGYWDTSSNAWKLFKKLLDSGNLSTDENGIYTYKGARLVAMTSTFGKAGDVIRVTQDDGSAYYGIIMDEKSQQYTWYDNNPANKYGHNNGIDIVEFEVKKSAIAPAYKANGGTPPYGNLNHAITLIENLGSLEGFDFSDMPSVGGTSVLTQKMQEFMSKLQQVYGTFKTNTHTSATKVGNVKSLGDKKQSSYSFDVPFTQREKGGIVSAGTIAQVNEHNKPEATIDEKGNLVPLGDGTSQVFVSDKPFPVINADDYAQIKKYGGDKKPVQFLKNGNTSVSVNADNTDEEKEQTAEERKAEENTSKINQTLKSIESKLDSGVLSDDIKKLDLPTLEAIDKLTDSWGDDDTITSDILMQFKDYAKDFADYEKWAEDDLSNILNSYSEDFYEKYYAEKDKYDSWQSDFKERFKKWVEHPTDGNYMSDYFKFADEASKKATESLITQQTLVADNMNDALDELKDKSEVLKKLIQDAPTAELAQKARDELKDINENIDEIESNYADTMEQITERKLQDIANRDSKYTRETGMLQYDRNILQDQYNRSTDDEEKAKLAKEITESMKKERDIEQERVDAAHKANQEIYENATGQRKTVLENVKMSELYNADGSFNDAAYNETVELLEGIGGSDLVQVFKQLASEMQKNSQVYLEGTENIRNLNNEIQDQEQEEANQKIELETSRYEKLNKILDVRLNKEKAITSALQEQYSFQQSLRDAALDYQSELIANKNLSQWLDDDTRELLFNENDYSKMMSEIDSLNAEVARKYKKYRADIAKLKPEEYYKEQQITNEYNRQVEELKEQLEVAKQNLDLTKKNAELQNTLKERDTRILVGDRWVNVADPEKLYNAQLESTKAQLSLDNLVQSNVENENVRDIERQSDLTQKMISANENYISELNNLNDDEKLRHAETLDSLDALIASNIMLSDNHIKWMNDYSTSGDSFYGQVYGLTDTELGEGWDYNNDHYGNIDRWKELYESGAISEDYYKRFANINENQHNLKDKSDPNSVQYSDMFEYGGKEYDYHMGANGDAKVQMKQTEQITDYAAELEKYYELAKKQNGYLSAEDRAKAQRLEIARNLKIYSSGLDYEQTSDFGAQIFTNDFSQDYSDIENFCKENGGLTEQEAIFFDSWHASHEEYIALADMLLSTGQDNTKLLSALNEQLGIKLSEMITNKIEEYNANLPSVGSIATAHYATGTKSAKGGLAITDEDGYEAKLRKLSVGRYSMLNAGDMVFDKEATDVLWEFAKNPQNFIDQVSIFKQSPQQMPTTNNSTPTTESITFTGDINVTDPVPDANAFVDSLTDKVKSQYPIIKNTKI